MKALRIEEPGRMALVEVPEPTAGIGEVVVEVRAAALNHRDLWIRLGQYAGSRYPVIPGSDGAGVVVSVGPEVPASLIGREVIINPALDWGPSERAQGGSFSILGSARDGTMAQRVCIATGQVSPKPAHLSWMQAGALPLAGLTAWRALMTRAQFVSGERLLVSGIGGGVALAALRLGVALGADVWVTSSSDEKIARAVALGARGGFNYTRPGWVAEAIAASTTPSSPSAVCSPSLASRPGFDVILDSAGGEGFASLADVAAPGGRIAVFGSTRGNPPSLALRKIFWRQLTLLGSTMGSPSDWSAFLAFVSRHRIETVVSETYPLERGLEAFARLESGAQFGKVVLSVEAD